MHRGHAVAAICAGLLVAIGPAFAAGSESGLPPTVSPFDADHDGALDLVEAQRGAEARFAKLDADHNGRLDKTEVAAAHVHRKGFRRVDANADQGLDLAEYQVLVASRFAAADANHDGKIDAAELRRKKGKVLRRLIEKSVMAAAQP